MIRYAWLVLLALWAVRAPAAKLMEMAPMEMAPMKSGPLEKDRRALLVVLDLSDHVADDLKSYYQYFESWGLDQARQAVGGDYRELRVLRGKEATLGGVSGALEELASEPGIEAVDAVLELHGMPGAMQFNESLYPAAEVRDCLLAHPGLRGKLRAVYSAACYGTTDGPFLIAGGFRVVSGARKVNTNGLYDLPAFLKSWHSGETFGAAQDKGNLLFWREFFDKHAERFGVSSQDADSFKDVYGDKDLTIHSPQAALE